MTINAFFQISSSASTKTITAFFSPNPPPTTTSHLLCSKANIQQIEVEVFKCEYAVRREIVSLAQVSKQ
ncbi:hypothetical protein L1987_59078 [Smallanthus sonchifolius]|uniref:Uncharacterized protein n=1 Tax=Smallanthus sonchifolius TaxID=185202 RepID=A0ACB9D4H9_9ASTR|nr:hypothetical protein L1987_59078 [Smallanthus sonchifolius]